MGKLGATGRFPRGRFARGDEGELRIAIGVRDKTVVIEFGKEVAWLGFDADTAEQLGNTLIRRAQECRTGKAN